MDNKCELASDFAYKLEWNAKLMLGCWGKPPESIGETLYPLGPDNTTSIITTKPAPKGHQGGRRGKCRRAFEECKLEWATLEAKESQGLHENVDRLLDKAIERLESSKQPDSKQELEEFSDELCEVADFIRHTRIEKKSLAGGDDGAGEDGTPTVDSIEQLELDTPKLDRQNGQWVSNKKAAAQEGIETRTLAKYRTDGKANPDKTFGRDNDGRVWRRDGTPSSHPWYLKSSLRGPQKP